MSDDDVSFQNHPALKNFNRTAFMAKHVVKNVLKWGAIGLLAGAAAAGGMALAGLAAGGIWTVIIGTAGVLLSPIPYLGDAIKWAGGALGNAALTGGLSLAAGGGVLGALIGGITAISNASEAADAEQDRLVSRYQQMESRHGRMDALSRKRDEQRYAMERQGMYMGGRGQQIPYGRTRDGMGQQAHTML